MPPAIQGDVPLETAWTRQIEAAQGAYVEAVEGLMARYAWVEDRVHRRKLAREAARSVLPNATEVKIVVSANVRAWRTMLELRLGEGAELEIRRMAVAVLRNLQSEAPALFGDFEIYRGEDGNESGRVEYHKVRGKDGKALPFSSKQISQNLLCVRSLFLTLVRRHRRTRAARPCRRPFL
jgi:thymidylate synthase (FAD)